MAVTGAVAAGRIGFRPLAEVDLPLLHLWLNSGEAQRWYGHGRRVSPEEIAAEYLPRVRGEQPTDSFLVIVGGLPVGYVQTYMIRDYPDYARFVQVEDGAAGVDLFIGDPAYIHRGLGVPILRKFLAEMVFGGLAPHVVGATCCVVGPEPANLAAIRIYEKAGFRYLKTVSVTGQEEVLMAVARAESGGTTRVP